MLDAGPGSREMMPKDADSFEEQPMVAMPYEDASHWHSMEQAANGLCPSPFFIECHVWSQWECG